jgi:putative salt-induced outer membrane protein YdiY
VRFPGFLLAVAALIFAIPAITAADTVVLQNGDHLTGTFVSADGKTMAFKTPYEGQVSVKWANVKEITTTEPIFVTTVSKKIVSGPITKTDGTLVVHTSTGTVDVPLAQVKLARSSKEEAKYQKSLHPSFTHNWKGNAGLGFSLARGNSHATNLTTSFNMRRNTLSDEITLAESSVYSTATAADTVTANAILGSARYDINANPLLFGFVSAVYAHDELQGLDLRQIYSGGLGWHAIANPNTTLNIAAGVNYTRETYNGSATLAPGVSVQRNLAAATTGEDFRHKFDKITSIDEQFYFYPDLSNDVGQYRFTLSATADTHVTGWLSWQVGLTDLYVSNPPLTGTVPNDVILSTSLVVTFSH